MNKFNLSLFTKLLIFSASFGLILIGIISFSIFSYSVLEEKDELRSSEYMFNDAFKERQKLTKSKDYQIHNSKNEAFIHAIEFLKFKGDNEKYQKIINVESEYIIQFKNYVKLLKDKGDSDNEGVESNFRRNLQKLEIKIQEQDIEQLNVILLLLRRSEKDFLSKRFPAYASKVEDLLFTLRSEVLKSKISTAKKSDIVVLINEFYFSFTEVVDLYQKLEESEKKLENIETTISNNFKEMSNHMDWYSSRITQVQFILFAFSILLAIVLSIKLSKDISKPFDELEKVATKIAHGDYTIRANVYSHDEIGKFAMIFNLMLDKLKQAYDILEINNKNLEQKIHERTKELEIEVETRTQTAEKLEHALIDLELAHKEITKSLAKEIELSDLKTRFVSNVSHEYRTPLTVILTSTYLIDEFIKRGKTEEIHLQISKVRKSVNHMNQLLNDVLTIGKIESGHINFENVRFDIVEYTGKLITEFAQSHIDFHIDFQSEEKEIDVILDDKILYIILTNLINNAIKYSSKSKKMEIVIFKKIDKVCFKIKDYGIGIPQKDKQYIFQPFHRSSNVDTVPGTGLGLSIIKRYIDAMNGKIWFESELGIGTTFYLELNLVFDEVDLNKNIIYN